MASHLDVKVGAADNGGEAKGRDHQHLITVWLSTCAIARCLLGNQGLVLRLNTAQQKHLCLSAHADSLLFEESFGQVLDISLCDYVLLWQCFEIGRYRFLASLGQCLCCKHSSKTS